MVYAITLQTSDSGIDPGEKIGIIGFAASNDDSGSDATTIAASIHAEAEGEFTTDSNKTSIVFSTASSGTDDNTSQLRISSSGHFLPITDNTKDLGASNLRFRNIFGNYGDFDNLTIAGASGFVVIDDLYSVSGYLQGQIDNIPADTNTFVTGVEYNTSQRNIILSRNDGIALTGDLSIVLHSGDNVSLLNNDIGYISTIPKRYSVTSTSNTFSSFTTAETYASGQIDIFQNGIKLHDGTDFTATNGSGVTLTNYAPNGSLIEYIISMTSGVATAAVFSPSDISGLQLWLDADDSSTITLNGSTVSQWNDKSGNSYNVSQGTASYQPTYSTAQLNGKNVVTFDGTADHILNDSLASVASGNNVPITMFIVFKQLSSGTNEYGVVFGSSSSIQPVFCMMTNSSQLAAQQRTDAGTLTTAYSSVSSTSAYRVQSIVLSSSNLTVYNNGTSAATSSFTPAQTSFDTFTIGAWRRSGSMNGIAFLHCDIAEVVIYNSALSTSDRNSVEDYLSSKWGIS